MADIEFSYLVDQPKLPADNPETEVRVLCRFSATPELRAAAADAKRGIHVVLCVDISSSMGRPELQAVREAARAVVREMRDIDVISVIGFHSVVYELVEGTMLATQQARAQVIDKLDTLLHLSGGGTDLTHALEKAGGQLMREDTVGYHKRVIIFTDGRVTGPEEACLEQARALAKRSITIDAMGFGRDFDFAFIQKLASYSNGAAILIDRTDDIYKVFRRRLRAATASVASNTRAVMRFTPAIRAGRAYRHSPDVGYLGKIRLPGDIRTIAIPFGDVEGDLEYAFLFTCTVPQREPGIVRLARIELNYDLPFADGTRALDPIDVLVEIVDDPLEARTFVAEVERVFDEVELGRLVEQLEAATKTSDNKKSALFFDILARRYDELGDTAMGDHYRRLKSDFGRTRSLSQEDLNYNRFKSTQKRSTGAKLVDASDLI